MPCKRSARPRYPRHSALGETLPDLLPHVHTHAKTEHGVTERETTTQVDTDQRHGTRQMLGEET
eukprot:1258492-Rhodomonas_salina.1